MSYVQLSSAARRILVARALRLLDLCLQGWHTWLEKRRSKRPEKEAQRRFGRQSMLRLAYPSWRAAVARHRGCASQMRSAAAHSRQATLRASMERWISARDVRMRVAVRTRRAYLFMAHHLLGAVFRAWQGVPEARRRLAAAVPRVTARLNALRHRYLLRRWQYAAACMHARCELLAGCDDRARASAMASAFRQMLLPVLLLQKRAVAALAVTRATRMARLSRHLRGWRVAYAQRKQGREAIVTLKRTLLRWRRMAGTTAHTAQLWTAACATSAVCQSIRSLRSWATYSAGLRLKIDALELAGRLGMHSARRRALHLWASRLQSALFAQGARETLQCKRISWALMIWRGKTWAAEREEAALRRATRHRYRQRIFWGFLMWSCFLARRCHLHRKRKTVEGALDFLRCQRAYLRWRVHTRESLSRRARAEAHAEKCALNHAVRAWLVDRAWAHENVCRRRLAEACYASSLCSRIISAWLLYVQLRVERREEKSAQVAAHRALLRMLKRARAFRHWRDELRCALVRCAHLAECENAWMARLMARTWAALQRNVVRRRVEYGQRRIAFVSAAALLSKGAVQKWCAFMSRRTGILESRRHAKALYARQLYRLCWAGWERYHIRKQHKAALMESAAVRFRREMRTRTVAAWLEVGLTLHAEKVERAAANTAMRAAESLRLAERFARRWLASVAERKGASSISDHVTGCHSRARRGIGAADQSRGAWTPPTIASEKTLARLQPFPEFVGVAVVDRPSTHGLNSPKNPPPHYQLIGQSRTANCRMMSGALAKSIESGVQESEWEALLPPRTTRRAPRPLPSFNEDDAIPLNLNFDSIHSAKDRPALSSISTCGSVKESFDWEDVRRRTRSALPLHSCLVEAGHSIARENPRQDKAEQAFAHPPPLQTYIAQKAEPANGQTYHQETVAPRGNAKPTQAKTVVSPVSIPLGSSLSSEPVSCNQSRSGPPDRFDYDTGGHDPCLDEVGQIEAKLRVYANLKAKHEANERLLGNLLAQAERLPPSQRPPLLLAARELRAAVDAYLDPIDSAARQADIEWLARRVAELGEA